MDGRSRRTRRGRCRPCWKTLSRVFPASPCAPSPRDGPTPAFTRRVRSCISIWRGPCRPSASATESTRSCPATSGSSRCRRRRPASTPGAAPSGRNTSTAGAAPRSSRRAIAPSSRRSRRRADAGRHARRGGRAAGGAGLRRLRRPPLRGRVEREESPLRPHRGIRRGDPGALPGRRVSAGHGPLDLRRPRGDRAGQGASRTDGRASRNRRQKTVVLQGPAWA